jgi:DNA primase
MDFDTIKNKNQLAALIEGLNLKRVASTGGGELAGPCPFCGGQDRFRVQPANNIWLCRNCTGGKWRDVIDYVARRDNLSIAQAAAKLTDGLTVSEHKPTPKPTYPAYGPPPQEWQDQARIAVKQCQNTLYTDTGAGALAYLQKRGFTPDTLRRFSIGFSTGYKSGDLWIPEGITIPGLIDGAIWYLKIRTNGRDGKPKYTLVKGSRPAALFNADGLRGGDKCLVTEGEFNAMIATQEGGDLIPVASMGGSASNRIDLATWGVYFMLTKLVLAQFDNDEAGEAGALALYDSLGERVKLAALPGTMDLNDFHLSGGDIREWIKGYLEFYND